MKLGIGLPTWTGNLIEPGAALDWARRAEARGFDAVVVHDRPNQDTWEPLVTLAAVAAVTSRVRIGTAVLILPTREERLLAKQAAVVDRISHGRLDLGFGVGNLAAGYEALGRTMTRRGPTFEAQLAHLEALWAEAAATAQAGTASGPAPWRGGRPRVWIGGYVEAAYDRAIRWGDGYIFGSPPVETMAREVPRIRERAAAAGRPDLPIAGATYVCASTEPGVLADAERLLTRYYGGLARPFEQMVPSGDADALRAAVARYEAAGLDQLNLFPVALDPGQVDALADALLTR